MWYVVYTKPRCEKKVHQQFLDNGFESYCPTQIIEKQWTDRVKKVELPLFTSYVFVKTSKEKISEVRFIKGVVNFVYWLGKPAQISEKAIEELQIFLDSNAADTIDVNTIQENDKILITKGAFKDNIGVVKKVLKSKTILLIEKLGIQITVSTKNKI
jgi:transcription antitermination factor NusG